MARPKSFVANPYPHKHGIVHTKAPELHVSFPLSKLHPGQRAVLTSKARFKVLACGRRWGKTRLGALLCVLAAINGKRAWWIGPAYKVTTVGWREIVRLSQQVPGARINKGEWQVIMPSGGWVQVRSAHDPQSLRGEGLDFVVFDEFAFTRPEAWTEAIRPALSDRKGRALFISTPKGRNLFWDLYQRGTPDQRGQHPDWESWTFPSVSNPFLDPDEVDEAQRSLPEQIFQQEYLAVFLEDGGGVFRHILEAVTAEPADRAVPGHQYVFGVDLAKYNDWTVISVLDVSGRKPSLVHTERFNQIDYSLQVGRIRAAAERWLPDAIVIERNSNDAVIEALTKAVAVKRPDLVLATNGHVCYAHHRSGEVEGPWYSRGEVPYPAEECRFGYVLRVGDPSRVASLDHAAGGSFWASNAGEFLPALPIQPFTTTHATKGFLIDSLAMAFERGQIEILNDPVLINELQAFEMERTPGGLLRYGAPEGRHDDHVMSLALAYYGIGRQATLSESLW